MILNAKIKKGYIYMKYEYPKYKLKVEFTPGTWGENDWQLGEIACVDRVFYSLPNGSEYAIFKFVERTITGRKKARWELWSDGRFANNYFNSFDEAVSRVDGEIDFNGFHGTRQKYRVYEY